MPGESWTEIETPPGEDQSQTYATTEGQTENPYAPDLAAAEALKVRDQLATKKENATDSKANDLKERINLEIYE